MKVKKRVLYVLFLIATLIILLELSPYVFSSVLLQKSFSKDEIKQALLDAYNKDNLVDQSESGKEVKKEKYLGNHILHPYLGFVSVPRDNYNRFCLPGDEPIVKKSKDTLNVCLMGGSVAKELYQRNKQDLINALNKIPKFSSKTIRVVAFALGGYKQPQQLMALNYFLSLGAEYDLVINLDGFNEIALPFADNLPFKVTSSYPRHWHLYSRKKLDSRIQLLLAKQIGTQERTKELNSSFAKGLMGKSNFGLLLWDMKHQQMQVEAFNLEQQLRDAMANSASDYQATGPWTGMEDTLSFFNEQANVWKESSLLISGLSKVKGFDYYHFLQPNQYVKGSKQLTEEEYRVAYQDSFAYKTAVEIGYSMLQLKGEELLHNGISFTDLTPLFKNEKQSVYRDKCCHFNELGYKQIAKSIGEAISVK